jgi:hypothetical protein
MFKRSAPISDGKDTEAESASTANKKEAEDEEDSHSTFCNIIQIIYQTYTSVTINQGTQIKKIIVTFKILPQRKTKQRHSHLGVFYDVFIYFCHIKLPISHLISCTEIVFLCGNILNVTIIVFICVPWLIVVYSLHARYTHSEVELRKCCLGQSAKSKIPYHSIKPYGVQNFILKKKLKIKHFFFKVQNFIRFQNFQHISKF